MLSLSRCFRQVSTSHYRSFSSLKFANVTLGGNYLRNSSFQIEQGEKVALLGNNARTKDAILKVLSGEVEPVSGEVTRAPKVLLYQPRHSNSDKMQTIGQYLKNSASTPLTDDVIRKVIHESIMCAYLMLECTDIGEC